MILIIACGSSKTPYIQNCSIKSGYIFKTVDFRSIPADLTEFDKIIISGAPILLTESSIDDYLQWFHPILSYKNPILGICFGHQILGLIDGASISRCAEDRDWQEINILKDSSLFKGIENLSKFTEDHCEAIDTPNNYTVLAKSSNCSNEAMQHNTKSRFGVQFHPETSGKNGQKLIDNFLTLC